MQIHSLGQLLSALADLAGGARVVDHEGLEMIVIVRKGQLWLYWAANGRKVYLHEISFPVAI